MKFRSGPRSTTSNRSSAGPMYRSAVDLRTQRGTISLSSILAAKMASSRRAEKSCAVLMTGIPAPLGQIQTGPLKCCLISRIRRRPGLRRRDIPGNSARKFLRLVHFAARSEW